MRRGIPLIVAAVIFWGSLGLATHADEPPVEKLDEKKIEEWTPLPPTVAQPHFIYPDYPVRSRYPSREVWQNFSIDYTGRFRPRVVLAPYGSYYYYNGEPYPWLTINSLSIKPYTNMPGK